MSRAGSSPIFLPTPIISLVKLLKMNGSRYHHQGLDICFMPSKLDSVPGGYGMSSVAANAYDTWFSILRSLSKQRCEILFC